MSTKKQAAKMDDQAFFNLSLSVVDMRAEIDALKAKADAAPVPPQAFDSDAAQHVEDALVGEWLTEQLEAGKSNVSLETVELIRVGIRLVLG